MSVKLNINITNDAEDKKDDKSVLTLPKYYKLSTLVSSNVNDENYRIPALFEDINRNLDLCGLPPLPVSKVAQIIQKLQDFQSEFLAYYADFSANVSDLQERTDAYLHSLTDEQKNILRNKENGELYIDNLFKPISTRFKNQDGEADVKVMISVPYKEKNTTYPTNPQAQPMIEYNEDGKEIEAVNNV